MPVALPTFGTIIGHGLDQDVSRWLSSLSAQPSSIFITNVNDLVSDLKAVDVWNYLDRFWLFATENRQHAQICLKSLSAITEVSSPIWTANRGYSGNSVGYLNTNYNPTTTSINYSQNNASFGFYSRSNTQGALVDMGTSNNGANGNGNLSNIRTSTNTLNFCINGTAIVGNANTDSRGLYLFSRTGSTTHQVYKNGTLFQSISNSSTSLINQNFYILSWNLSNISTNASNRELSMAFVGSSSFNQEKFYQIFQEFAVKQGFNV